jgi:hypothetical protein
MKTDVCIYCGKTNKGKSPGLLFCSNRCKNKAMIEDPEFYYHKINEIKERKLQYKKLLNELIENAKEEDKKTYRERGEYVVRQGTVNNKTGDAWVITLPKSARENKERLVCENLSNGIILFTPTSVYKDVERRVYSNFRVCSNKDCSFKTYFKDFEFCPICRQELRVVVKCNKDLKEVKEVKEDEGKDTKDIDE